ncbi:MAG: DAK2 domain-containing protein [Candidatus Nanopelagicales bacterium]
MPSEAEIIRLWAARGVELLKTHISELNSLNVFPVADRDTGTNLYLTFQSAQHFERSRTGDTHDIIDAFSALAKGAVNGARGNSGVILAEALVGVVEGLNQSDYTVASLLESAAQKARESVSEPQPGTILTLLDSIAALKSNNLENIAKESREILIESRDLLPQLRDAGVVDAGGRGLVILLDALVQVCQGKEEESPPVGFVPTELPATLCLADREFEVIVKTHNADMKYIQERLQALGTSITTTSDGEVTLVHIHTDVPKLVISALEESSQVWDINIENLKPSSAQTGCVVVVEGIGNVMNMVAMGATAISAEDSSPETLAQAIMKSNYQDVIVLIPNESELSAKMAVERLNEFDLNVFTLVTPSVVSMLASYAVFDSKVPIEKTVSVMRNALDSVHTINVKSSDIQAFDAEIMKRAELVTIVWGEGADSIFKHRLRELIHENAAKAEIVEISGDQHSSLAVIGVE